MERTIQKFSSFREADRADANYYRTLTAPQRMDILLEILKQGQTDHEAERRLERVYRIVKLSES